VRGWRDGERRDIAQAMNRLTLDIVAKTLFDADLRGRAQEIGRALTAVLDAFTVLFIFVGDDMLRWPLPRTRRARRAIPVLDAAIYAVIEERRRSGEDRGDLLSMLLAARDTEADGSGMSDAQLRDEVMTLFLAGHETTANALAWTWWYVAQHPHVEQRLHEEIDSVLGGRLPVMDDVPRLPYTKAVFSESLRLRPPAYATTRQVVGAYTLGGYVVPVGAQVMVSPWVTQRDPRWWHDPLTFDPDRWARGEPLHKGAYFPFGGGTRICIGEQFAWTEGVLLLATIAQRWRLPLAVAPQHVRAQAAVTLRPVPSVPVTVVRRSPLL
jgi:cytochrome P450